MKTFRSDSEKILVEGNVEEFLNNMNVEPEFSLPYNHHQNLVDRHVLTITKTVSAIIHDQVLLDASFWDYAIFHTVNLRNNTPNTKTNGLTPNRMVTRCGQVDLIRQFLFPFASPVLARLPKRTWKFDVRNELGIYLGEAKGSVRGGLVYYPSSKAILNRGDLVQLSIRQEDFKQ